jgi:Mor family transcriptional regulator
MYSPNPMEGRRETPDLGELDAKVGELESLADTLDAVPDEELVATLDRAVELLREINARIERELEAAGDEANEVGAIIERLDLEPFDETLEEFERREQNSGEP